MDVIARLRSLAHRHPDLAELGLGLAVGLAVLVASITQWGPTDTGIARGFLFGVPLAVLTTATYRRRRRRDEERERRLLDARVQLARELHDAVAGQVAVIGIQAAAARLVLTQQPDAAAEALERIETASRAAVSDLRRMLIALREGGDMAPPAMRQPGLDQVEQLVDEAGRGSVDVSVAISGRRPEPIDGAVDRAAYRILQEALTNAVKHGTGGAAAVEIDYGPDQLRLRVWSSAPTNGVSSAPTARKAGLGLRGMQERAALLGGEVVAGPTPNGEWLVDVHLPWPGEAQP